MYFIVCIIGSVLRQFYLPNPFIIIFENQGIGDLFNLIVGGVIIGFLSYVITGCIYEKGSFPALGSFLYTFNYALITFSFSGITILIKNIYIAIALFLFLYGIGCIFLLRFKNQSCDF